MEWTTDRIRAEFLAFFNGKGHAIVPSAPIVVKDDPTLMFTNAGMNQFKGVFLGNASIQTPRVADSQKCLRVSGKHNDLEEVGRDHYHHTMFEMLGNWSFGDYFKAEAIDWAWELLTSVYRLDPDRLYVTVFQGDPEMKLELDQEAVDLWSKHMPSERILPFGKKDNFWEMGDTGPCGPCSEIHYDLRSDEERKTSNAAMLVNADHPEVIEIWNLVFIQFNRLENGSLELLKNRHVDTGMGLERLCRALQHKRSNYDTDVFRALIARTEDLSSKTYSGSDSLADVAFRVIADHVRAVSFCIADGQLPASNGAGYVIRRVLRRAVRYGYSQLGIERPFLFAVAERLAELMGQQYPELVTQGNLVARVIQEEERSFLSTLDKGLWRMETYLNAHSGDTISGDFAFELYDTYGFPIDLTQLIAAEKGVNVDMQAFHKALEVQKDRSRNASKAEYGDWSVLREGDNSHFLGYDTTEATTRIAKFRRVKMKGKDSFQVVLMETPFYAESGGQVGDTGHLHFEGETVQVLDTKKENGEFVHYVERIPENIDGEVRAIVNAEGRQMTTRNHSATHLLHMALRNHLGSHVEQKGSLVDPDRLRFDFSHFEKISEDQLEQIEGEVKDLIRQNEPLEEWRAMPIDEARAMGAMALFGEKYGSEVRVVKFGASVELCGGTHVRQTGEIGGFKLLSESSIASGVRRVEAITGSAYEAYIAGQLSELRDVRAALGNPKDAVQAVDRLQAEMKEMQATLESYRAREQAQWVRELEARAVQKADAQFVSLHLGEVDARMAKDVVYHFVNGADNRVALIGSTDGEKVSVVVGASGSFAQAHPAFDAAAVIKAIAQDIQGGGGGQKFLATAGGKNKSGLDAAMQKAERLIAESAF